MLTVKAIAQEGCDRALEDNIVMLFKALNTAWTTAKTQKGKQAALDRFELGLKNQAAIHESASATIAKSL